MLLAADVGNTNVKLGIFDGDNLKFKLRFSTDENKTSDELAVELYTFLQIYNIDAKNIDGAIISSVVPKFTYNLRRAIMTVTDRKSLLIGPGLKTGLDIKIEHPETLGADIVAGCVGACEKYGGPLIMIFMGTATAIVYVDASNAYHGGAIAPGMGISLDALTNHGALLSSVDMKAPKKDNTANNSKRPINIRNDNIHLAASGNAAHEKAGPNAPSPGPTLPKLEITVLIASIIPTPKNISSIHPAKIQNK